MAVHKVPAAGRIETIGEFRNAHRGAMLIWRAMCKKYLGLEYVPFEESELDPLWKLADDLTIPRQVRLVHASTFDKVMVRRENLELLADAMDHFAETVCPEDSGHLKPHAVLLREAAKDASLFAVCWTQTSASDDIWKIWEGEDDVRYYDVSRDEGHWFLFDKVGAVKGAGKETHTVQAKDPKCSVCRGEKCIEVKRNALDDDGVTVIDGSVTIESPGYELKQGERLGRVFCSRCGLDFHEDSIA